MSDLTDRKELAVNESRYIYALDPESDVGKKVDHETYGGANISTM
jgi:hypothetical protein